MTFWSDELGKLLVKRVVGLPGEEVSFSGGYTYINGQQLEEPYLTYSEPQDAQGFDLAACCGKQVARYTYTVTNYPGRPEGVQANLYVCEGRPAAGDILCAGADGFQDTLVYPEAAE